jgi:hypothetical protein
MIKVELSSVTAIPLGNAIPSARWRTTPSGLIAAPKSIVPATAYIQLGRFPRESLMASTVGISAR